MNSTKQSHGSAWRTFPRATTAAMIMAVVSALIMGMSQPAQAQHFQVIYNFTNGADGAFPYAGFSVDQTGNFYGTAAAGGWFGENCGGGCGTIYKISPSGSFSPVYAFTGGSDGSSPYARVIFGPDGGLYGNVLLGGRPTCAWHDQSAIGGPCGLVFSLSGGTGTVLYSFWGARDGYSPRGDVVFDQAGNLYGNAAYGGYFGGNCTPSYGSPWGCGTVFQLTHSNSGWTENTLYSFTGGNDGVLPVGGLIIDGAGNLYGITYAGGNLNSMCPARGCGTVFELARSGSGWTEKILYRFQGGQDGAVPDGGLVMDSAGNLYGTTGSAGGTGCGGYGCGGVFQLSPSNGSWVLTVLHQFTNGDEGSWAPLTFDAADNLYGTTFYDGAYVEGSVFKMTRSGGTWTYTSLHDFDCPGGCDPASNVTIDANGNLYGTTTLGGTYGYGVVWKITP